MNRAWCGIIFIFLAVAAGWTGSVSAQADSSTAGSLIAPGAALEKLPGSFNFTEGPVADNRGNVYFSDYRNNRICMWSVEGKLSVFLENARGPVGLDIDRGGNLIVASTNDRAILSIDPKNKRVSVLADRYNGRRLNSPNDLWCDPKGGVYFTDPRFVTLSFPKEQDIEGVYYLSPDRKRLTRVIGDMAKPNGVVGSPDGSRLYVDDTAKNETCVYTVNPDGSLSGKKPFAPVGYDGLTTDSRGNVYITGDGLDVFSPSGEKIGHIEVPDKPTNVCFGGVDGKTLFITTRPAVYLLRMRTMGVTR